MTKARLSGLLLSIFLSVLTTPALGAYEIDIKYHQQAMQRFNVQLKELAQKIGVNRAEYQFYTVRISQQQTDLEQATQDIKRFEGSQKSICEHELECREITHRATTLQVFIRGDIKRMKQLDALLRPLQHRVVRMRLMRRDTQLELDELFRKQ